MIPAFALVFREDSVSLLHREEGGWTSLGDLRLDREDLAERLADLRDRAEALAPGALTTKLGLPNSQILYTRVPLPGNDAAADVRAALDGLTPYDVSDLAYDWQMQDGEAHLAVIARETLHEAEGFATDHGFNPVAFFAEAPAGRLPAEPWFGPTMVAGRFLGTDVAERDTLAISTRLPAEEEPPVSPTPEEDEAWDAAEEAILLDAPQDTPEREDELPEDAPTETVEAADDWLPEDAPSEDLPPDEAPLPANPAPAETPAVQDDDPDDRWPEERWTAPAAPQDDLPSLKDDPEEHWSDAVSHPDNTGDDDPEDHWTDAPEAPASAEPDPEAARPPAPPTAEPEPVIAAPRLAPAADAPVFDHPSFVQKPEALRAERTPAAPRRAPPVGLRTAPPVTAKGEAPFVDFGRTSPVPPVDMTPPPLRVTQNRSNSPAGRAAALDTGRPKPKRLGLVLTVLLLLALAFVAAASAYFMEDGTEAAALQPAPVTDIAVAAAQPEPLPDPATPTLSPAPRGSYTLAALVATAADASPAPASPAAEGPSTDISSRPPQIRPEPPSDPILAETTPEAAPETPDAAFVVQMDPVGRPQSRPEALNTPTVEELTEAADSEGALTASPRPQERPESAANAAIVALTDEPGTALAVAVSQRPEARPSGVSRQAVNDALTAALAPPVAAAPPAAPAPVVAPPVAPVRAAPQVTARVEAEADDEPEPAPTAPRIPTKASVAQNATQTAALPMGKANVISITGGSNNRTALIRMSNGKITRVRVGDRIEGGTIAAITETAIHYRKGSTLYALAMPS